MRKTLVGVWMALASVCAFAQGAGREAFMQRQAMDEVIRVSGQVDVLQANQEELSSRLSKLEGGGDVRALRAEVDSLKADIAAVRREMQNLHGEIVKDMTKKIQEILRQQQPSAPVATRPVSQPATPRMPPQGVQEYVVDSGDSLYMIALAFRTTVAELKRLNSLKSDRLSIGQKLLVPKTK